MAASKTLGEAILVPEVYTALNTRYVLVTEWVEGVKVNYLFCLFYCTVAFLCFERVLALLIFRPIVLSSYQVRAPNGTVTLL